jgi:hypothetical protein
MTTKTLFLLKTPTIERVMKEGEPSYGGEGEAAARSNGGGCRRVLPNSLLLYPLVTESA